MSAPSTLSVHSAFSLSCPLSVNDLVYHWSVMLCNISLCIVSSVALSISISPSLSLPSPPLPQAGQLSSVEEVTEKVAVAKALEPDHYALYMVLGDAVSGMYSPHITPSALPTVHTSHLHITRTPLTRPLPSLSERFLHPSEGILQVIQDCRTDHYLCIKPNTLHLVLRDHVSSPSVRDVRVCDVHTYI